MPPERAILPAVEPAAPTTARQHALRDFALDFFRSFSAQITERPADGSVWIDLPPALSAHFGKPALHLAFHNAEVTSHTDLVAYGSRLYDQMMDYLDAQGGVTLLQLPRRFQGADQLLRAVQPRNVAVLGLKLAEEEQRIFALNWHITYRSDDKREELYTVVLNSDGLRIPLAEDGSDGLTLERLLQDGEPFTGEDNDAAPASAPRLPPMTHLTRLAESARKFALYHADLRCVAFESAILPRLHKVLSRLTSYYEQQIGEVYDSHDPQGEKRRVLEDDLQRKIAEEIENHRLRVQVRLFSYAILHIPVAQANLTLGDGKRSTTIQVTRNLYTGELTRPACHACGNPLLALLLDRAGHLICDDCLRQCRQCNEILCDRCGLHPCPVCADELCGECSVYCWSCGQRACPAHSSRCPVCADDVCHSCQELCAECGIRQCRSHLRMDGVTGGLICRGCAVRCPACHQDSSRLTRCSTSGQRFCNNCIVSCHSCGRAVGPAFATQDPTDGQAYCADCLSACPSCGELVSKRADVGCQICGVAGCGHCAQRCHFCARLLCASHAQACRECGRVLCPEDQTHCALGGEALCPTCNSLCASCGYSHCGGHTLQCTLCLQAYCAACVDESGECETCREFPARYREMVMPEEPIAADPRIANLMYRHHWIGHSNQRYTIYLGASAWNSQVLVVAEGATVRHVRRGVFFRRLLGEE
ncbi:MAG: hypothetical protein KJZ86_27005 [Caldilineaceae bacterium]|nr:hypothetical protein [Caldilineaceae bacterium]HRJ42469.1 hypothetical protein [Caldilineaceae bacterium]